MSSLSDAMARHYGRLPDSVSGLLGQLRSAYGTIRAAASAAGVSERSWRRWAAGGTVPMPSSRGKLERAAWSAQIDSRGLPGRDSMIIEYLQYAPRALPRKRTVTGRALDLPPAIGGRLGASIAAQDWERAARLLALNIATDVYQVFFTLSDPQRGVVGELDSGSEYQIVVKGWSP